MQQDVHIFVLERPKWRC